jgi:hypothetical protein
MSRLPSKCRSRGAKDGQPDALIVRWQLIPQLFFEVLAKKSASTRCTCLQLHLGQRGCDFSCSATYSLRSKTFPHLLQRYS